MRILIGVVILIVALLVVGFQSVFIVDEKDQVIVLQFGKFIRAVREPGLHTKIPFIQDLTRYDKRLLRYDAAQDDFLTRDKKTLVVDTYTRYRISDPLKFFEILQNIPRANARLGAIISSLVREAVASHDQSEIVTDKREPIMAEVLQQAQEKVSGFGIEILDVRIKRTDFKREIAESIYARMRAERDRISKRYRSEGAEEQLKIKAETDKESAIILAEAKKQSETIRGEGDAGAIKIYADALQQDPEFYSFLKSLQIYRESMKEGTKLVLTTDSSLFQYLESPKLGKP